MNPGMAVLVIGVASLGMAAPLTAMAGHERDIDMPHTIITVVCTVSADQTLADLIVALNMGGYMPDCNMTAEFVEASGPTADVAVSEGSLYPQCADTDSCFEPHTITVEPGTAVTWTNHDDVVHTITESVPVPLFDGWTFPGEEFTFTFDEAGTHAYGCTLHPWASGVVMVGSGAMQTTPDETAEPETAEPETAEPETAEPETAEPETAEPETAEPETAEDNPQLAYDLVDELISLYIEEGDDAFDTINAMASDQDQPVQGFVVDADSYEIAAHSANPLFVGFNVGPLLEKASIPIEVMLQIVSQEDEGVWLSYPLPDPTGNIIGYERGWMKLHDGYVFVARYSVDVEERIQGIVQEMIRIYNLNPETAFDTITSFMSDDPSYPFVTHIETQIIAAHGSNPARVGTTSVILTDSSIPYEEFLEMDEGDGVWVEYAFASPTTGEDQAKRSWVVVHNGYIFGAGYYP